MSIRVVLVDDRADVRRMLREMLEPEADIVVAGEAGDGVAAVSLLSVVRPDVALVDLRMEPLDGIATTRRLVEAGTRCAVVILTLFGADRDVLAAMEAGARGYVLKDAGPEAIVSAVRMVAAGGAVFVPAELRSAVVVSASAGLTDDQRRALDSLTPRERDVLALIAAGRSNAAMAEALYVSEDTIRAHMSHVLAKLGCNRIQAAVLAYRAGMDSAGGGRPLTP